MEIIIKDINQLEEVIPLALDFANNRRKWLFFGEIGAGKTTFIQRFCRHLGVQDPVTSPTFSLVNEYTYPAQNPADSAETMYHLDLYRLKNVEEAIDIGIEEYLEDSRYCLIEWPEIIEPLWPETPVKINIEILEDSSRKILFL